MNDRVSKIEASLMVAVYKRPDFLRRTLVALSHQSLMSFEIIICDDGSGEEISELLEEFRCRFSNGIVHVHHEDFGFRKCKILNMGILRAQSDYLVFLDADCMPHRLFMEEHVCQKERGVFLTGRRVELSQSMTETLDESVIVSGPLENIWFTGLPDAIRGNMRHLEYGLRIPGWLRLKCDNGNTSLLGCNFSCWKEDLYRINGFNEDFITASGGEDTDIERRFRMIGLKSKSVKHSALCYHQYHPLVAGREQSDDMCRQLKDAGQVECKHGLKQYNE